jgi:hypothetical protein
VPIQVLDIKHVIGHAGRGNMKLNEFFPSPDKQDNDKDIDWADDLKFFIDNEPRLLSNYLFPAVKKHKDYIKHPKAYKIYLKPLNSCMKEYCKTFDIEDPGKKFPKELLIDLAKKIAEEQKKHLEDGDYETK